MLKTPLRTNCIIIVREGEMGTYKEFECHEYSPFELIWNSPWSHEKSNFIQRISMAKTKLLSLEREFFFWRNWKCWDLERERERERETGFI